jgi:hypothetical protein
MLSNLILLALIVGLHGYWIYALATYAWDKFEEDQAAYGDDMW